MYQIVGHDGVRFFKLVLLFKDQKNLVAKLHENNKFVVSKGVFVSRVDGAISLLIDSVDQIRNVFTDVSSARLTESTMDIKGLPIKKTGAPRFVFLDGKGKRAD